MKRLLWLLLVLSICQRPALAQVALDTSTTGQCGNTGALTNCNTTTTLSITHTTGAGSNRAMAVLIKESCSAGSTATALTSMQYAGTQNLSEIATVNGGSAARYAKLWALPAGTQPTTGSNALVITFAGNINTDCAGGNTVTATVFTASGVDQTTTFSSNNTNSGNSAGPATVTISTSGANDKGIMAACVGDTFTGTLSSGLTQVFKYDDTATGCSSDERATSTGGTTVHSANLSASDSWLIVAAAFKAAGGGGTTLSSYYYRMVGGMGGAMILLMMLNLGARKIYEPIEFPSFRSGDRGDIYILAASRVEALPPLKRLVITEDSGEVWRDQGEPQ